MKTTLLVGVLGVGIGVLAATDAKAAELLDTNPQGITRNITNPAASSKIEQPDEVYFSPDDEKKIHEIINAYLEQGYFVTGVSIGESDINQTLASIPADSEVVVDTSSYHIKGFFFVDDNNDLDYQDVGIIPVPPKKIATAMESGVFIYQMRDLAPSEDFWALREFQGVGIFIDGAALRDGRALRTATPAPPVPADITRPDTYTVEIFPSDFINVAVFSFLHPAQCAALREDNTGSTSPR